MSTADRCKHTLDDMDLCAMERCPICEVERLKEGQLFLADRCESEKARAERAEADARLLAAVMATVIDRANLKTWPAQIASGIEAAVERWRTKP